MLVLAPCPTRAWTYSTSVRIPAATKITSTRTQTHVDLLKIAEESELDLPLPSLMSWEMAWSILHWQLRQALLTAAFTKWIYISADFMFSVVLRGLVFQTAIVALFCYVTCVLGGWMGMDKTHCGARLLQPGPAPPCPWVGPPHTHRFPWRPRPAPHPMRFRGNYTL